MHGRNEAISATEPAYVRLPVGTIETSFQTAKPSSSNPFPTEVLSIEAVEPRFAASLQCHQAVDCTCQDCNDDSYQVELDLEYKRKYFSKARKKRSPQQILQDRYEAGDPKVGLLEEPSGKFDFYVLYPKKNQQLPPSIPPDDWGHKPPSPPPLMTPTPPILSPYYQKALTCLYQAKPTKPIAPAPQILDCCMFSPSSSTYNEHFPTLEEFELPQQNTKHSWKIKTPARKNPDGTSKRIFPAEASLNWQAENAVKQNQILTKILENQTSLQTAVTKQLNSLDSLIQDLRTQIAKLKSELSHIARTVKDYYQALELIRAKEAEKKNLEN